MYCVVKYVENKMTQIDSVVEVKEDPETAEQAQAELNKEFTSHVIKKMLDTIKLTFTADVIKANKVEHDNGGEA